MARPASSTVNRVVSPNPKKPNVTKNTKPIYSGRLNNRMATATFANQPIENVDHEERRQRNDVEEEEANSDVINQDPAIAVAVMRHNSNDSNAIHGNYLHAPDKGSQQHSSTSSLSNNVLNHSHSTASSATGSGGATTTTTAAAVTATSTVAAPTSSSAEQHITRSDSGGFLSSLFTAAANKMISGIPEETKEKKREHSFANKLDNLIKSVRHDESKFIGGGEATADNNGQESTENVVAGETNQPGLARTNSNPASNVQFEPVRESPLNTLGNGDLSLADFENSTHNHIRLPSRQTSMLSSNDGRSQSIKRKLSPDATNRTVPQGNQPLLVANGVDTKRAHRRSINGSSSAVDRSGSIGRTSQLSANGYSEDNTRNRSEGKSRGTLDDGESRDNSDSEPDEIDHTIDYSKKIKHASRKANREFHHAFKKIPKSEKLIADFSCALSKDILVQGKMYLSDHYICFNSNILGWVTHIMIPLQEVIQIEKKSTAVLFPNGMIIRTLHQKYVFATILSRDTAFDLITSIWHRVLLQNSDLDPNKLRTTRIRAGSKSSIMSAGSLTDSGESSDDEFSGGTDEYDDNISLAGTEEEVESNGGDEGDGEEEKEKERDKKKDKDGSEASDGGEKWKGFAIVGPATHAPTENGYVKDSGDTFIAEDIIKAPPGVVYLLLFGHETSYFSRILKEQKNFDIDESAIHALSTDSKSRHYTYTKPLSGPIGPKQTKCVIDDNLLEYNPDKVYGVEQVTQTPDVPSGNSFKVKTKLFFSWAEKNQTKLYVATSIEWNGKSWIKGAIEKGTIDGQKESMKEMIETLNNIIAEGGKKGGTGGDSGKRKSTKARRNTEKKEKQEEKPSIEEQKTPPGIAQQLINLIDSVGDLVPVPMLSNTIVGSVIFLIGFLFSIFIFNKIGGIFSFGSSQKAVFEILPSNAYTSRIKINDKDFLVVPMINTNFANERKQRQQEINIWNWLESRSDGEFGKEFKGNTDNSRLSSAAFFSDNFDNLSDKELREKYSGQELKELLKVTKLELDKLSKRINRMGQ
ncbi:hypothetical protein KGF56_001455 [Candida oxycetoniae]|uniref:VASt domain-containing protein n=1 Tax=Candida oxycetoniae TaxID=497107 RepID=A0AAI9SZ18_9ASCO|nr:uncharacterized protein KGF56_001455 [Candida oxycetoniae]KAI3405848.2 hypothetical protein KGF56_001455 [Candida oxycetoniae]